MLRRRSKSPSSTLSSLRSSGRTLWMGEDSGVARAECAVLREAGHDITLAGIGPGSAVDTAGFDTIVVQNDAALFADLLRHCGLRLIYRTHGETGSIGDRFAMCGAAKLLERNSRAFVAATIDLERAKLEPSWLTQRARHVPHWVSPWFQSAVHSRSVGDGPMVVTMPEEAAPGGGPERMRGYFHAYFAGGYGATALRCPVDPTTPWLSRPENEDVVRGLQSVPGCVSLFPDAWRLPFILVELLAIGVPILYFPGCLLSRLIGADGPGEVHTIREAREVGNRLRAGDKELARAIVDAQSRSGAFLNPAQSSADFLQRMGALLTGVEDGPSTVVGPSGLGSPEADQALRLAYDLIASQDANLLQDGHVARQAICTIYHLFLKREPDEGGLEAYASRLRREQDYLAIMMEFINSAEYIARGNDNALLKWIGN